MALCLTDLPHDCLTLIVGRVPLRSIASLARTCKYLRDFLRQPDAWLAYCALCDVPLAPPHACAQACEPLVAWLRDATSFVIDARVHGDRLVVAPSGRSAAIPFDVDGEPLSGPQRARSLRAVPRDGRVHVYRVRFTVDERQAVGMMANGCRALCEFFVAWDEQSGETLARVRPGVSLLEVHVRMLAQQHLVRLAVIDPDECVGYEALDVALRSSPAPAGVSISSTCSIADCVHEGETALPPIHVVFALSAIGARVDLLGHASYEPSSAFDGFGVV